MPSNGVGNPAVGTEWTSGALVFFDRSTGTTIFTVDPTNLKLSIGATAKLDLGAVDIDATELGFLDGASAGTATASKAAIYDSAGKLVRSVAAPSAAGANQNQATGLTADLNAVTGATGTNGVRLPTAAAGDSLIVINTHTANALLVYPATGAQINGGGANAAVTVRPLMAVEFVCTAALTWYAGPQSIAVAQMADLARGSILTGQTASNRPAALDAKTAGQILVGNGTDLLSVPVSGDATLAASGALTIAQAPSVGKVATGRVRFGGVGDCTSVTVAAVTYTRGVADVPNGVWAEGASAAESATNLAASVNGDTRNGGSNSYNAIAVGATCFFLAKAVGVAGNVAVARVGGTEPATAENMIGGVAVGPKKFVQVAHAVTAAEAAEDAVEIPLPITPTTFSVTVLTSTGAPKTITDLITLVAAPDHISILANGATHVASGDVITVTCCE